jgi:hypothetical protein
VSPQHDDHHLPRGLCGAIMDVVAPHSHDDGHRPHADVEAGLTRAYPAEHDVA